MDTSQMSIKVFFRELQLKGYESSAFDKNTRVGTMDELEKDAKRVFKYWYGKRPDFNSKTTAWEHHYAQAQYDKSVGFIHHLIHYIFMQEKVEKEAKKFQV